MTGQQLRHLAAAIGWVVLIALAALALASIFVSPSSSLIVSAAVAAFCVLALARPADAFLVTAALVGFSGILSYLAGTPSVRVTEVLVVASLLGCCVHALAAGSAFRAAVMQCISPPLVLFGIAAVASTVVWLRVDQVRTESGFAYASALLRFLRHDYFFTGDPRWLIVISTAAVIEGLGLFVMAAALCRIRPAFFEQALRMLALGGAGLAMMSILRLAEIALRNPKIVETLRSTYAGLRISPQIPDYIAAGAYFALCWLVTLGLALASRRRFAWLIAGIPLIAGLYLTGSRSPIFAAAGGTAVMMVALVRRGNIPRRVVALFAVAALVAIVLSFRLIIGHDLVGETAWQSVIVRYELMRTGLRVVATRPVFGVGIDRFFVPAEELATPRLKAMWNARKNPHNDFLRVGAELGLVGLALFLWILGSAVIRIGRALRTSGDPPLAGLAGGLTGFLITSVASNPLMVREVSYVFWIALGLAVGRCVESSPARVRASESAARSMRTSTFRWAAASLVSGSLLASIPFRAVQELASVDPGRVSYGLSDWVAEADGTRYRTSGARATVYVPGRARLLEIPLKGTLPWVGIQRVDIVIDGRLVNTVNVAGDWQRFRTMLPGDVATGSRRIDFLVSPCWVPAEVFPGSQDRRVVGVGLGEIKIVVRSDQSR